MTHVFKWMDTPVGRLKLVASEKGLAAILWPDDNPIRTLRNKLNEYTAAGISVPAPQSGASAA